MFARVKSSVLSGAFGSLLTVFLMYHILKLGVTETYTHYLDSTEITNYTLIESLLLTKVPELTPKKNSRSDNIHLSLNELKYLASSYKPVKTTSILLQYSTLSLLQLQLQAIHNNQIHSTNDNIHIICETEKEKSTIEKFIFEKNEKYKVSVKKDSVWFRHVNNIESDYIVIMDKQVIPGQGYFHFITGLLNQPQFHHTLIGTETSGINICQQDEAHYVNKLNDIYVLRREWYSAFIHQSAFTDINEFLSQQLNIPSVIIPKSPTGQQLHGNTKNACVHVHPNGLLFIRESTELDTMICQFSNQHEIIHLVNWKHTGNISCTSNNVILEHSIIKMEQELNRIIDKISPSVVLYEKTEHQIGHLQDITFIGLPTKSISQVTPWITDLSLETLQKWHKPKIDILVTTGGKRVKELKQLLRDIKKADYLGDENVELNILMDEKSDSSLNYYVNYNMTWNHGNKNLRHRISGVHPMQIFTEAWYPSNDDEYAVILDDRIELPNSYYIWLKYTLLKYRYSEQQQINVFGISLYSPRIIDTDPLGRQLLKSPPKTPYLMQIPNSLGGALYFPEYWREFHDYITARLTDQATVKRGSGQPHLFKDSLLTIAKSNKWISSYRKYFDEMIYMRGYVMLYPPFGSSYSTMKSASKTQIKNKKKLEMYSAADKLYQVTLANSVRELPDLELLPILDLHGKSISKKEELIERGHYLQHKFSACEPILNHSNDPSDMLCPFNHWIQVPIEQTTPISTKTVQILLPSSL